MSNKPTAVDTARWLLAGVMVALLVSPPVTVLLEFALYALMLGSGDLRARLVRAARQPLGVMALVFWLALGLGLAYSVAPWQEGLAIWAAWRRLLLLVFALALFDDPAWKQRLAWILIVVATVGALGSYASWLAGVGLRYYPVGTVFRNYATQGMIFAVAAFAAVLMFKEELPKSQRAFLVGAAVLLLVNIVFVNPSRSAHGALLVLGAALAWGWAGGRAPLRRLAWVGAAGLLGVAALASSPTARHRIELGITEMRNYQEGTQVSSMGERIVYWRNALALAKERPLFGYGTGGFAAAYAVEVQGRTGREGIKAEDPHNMYLYIIVQIGLAGLAVFLVLLASALRHAVAPPWRLLGLGALAAWCATSLFNGHFATFAEGRFIWLWLGACLALPDFRLPEVSREGALPREHHA